RPHPPHHQYKSPTTTATPSPTADTRSTNASPAPTSSRTKPDADTPPSTTPSTHWQPKASSRDKTGRARWCVQHHDHASSTPTGTSAKSKPATAGMYPHHRQSRATSTYRGKTTPCRYSTRRQRQRHTVKPNSWAPTTANLSTEGAHSAAH